MSGYLAPINRFYTANRTALNWKWIKMQNHGEHKAHPTRAYTREEIVQVLTVCDPRAKALVLLLSSSGLRIGAVPELKIKHLKAIDEYKLYQITTYQGYKEQYPAFTTPEARQALDHYFKTREEAGEKLTANSPIFRDKINRNNNLKVRHPRHLTDNGMEKLLYELVMRSGVKKVIKLDNENRKGTIRHEVQTSHGFRKFAETAMVENDVNLMSADKLIGHSNGVQHDYHKPTEAQLLRQYLKAIDALTIDPKNRLAKKVEELEAEKNQINILSRQVDEMRQGMLQLMRFATVQNLELIHNTALEKPMSDEERKDLWKKFGVKMP